jgi:hypothetical protein
MRTGLVVPSYSTVTWLLASGRRPGMTLRGGRSPALDEAVGELDRQGHEGFGRFAAGEAEHHALVAGALAVDAHGDVGGLLVEGDDDAQLSASKRMSASV